MTLFEIILSLIAAIFAVAAGFAAIGYFRQGKNQSKLDTVNLLKEDVEVLRGKVEELTKEVQNLRAENAEEKKKFTDAILAIQGRDPALQAFIASVKEYVESNKPVIEQIKIEVLPVVKKLDKFLDKQII